MEIDKVKVVALLRQRGLDDRAAWVDRTLPERIDVYQNAGLLATLSIVPAELADEPADEPAKGS
jgi:hypothetical protein